jgi:hypothetical protein
MLQHTNERDDVLSHSMSYLQKILFGNKKLHERPGNNDEEVGIVKDSIFSCGSRPLFPYSKPETESIVNRDDVFTGLNIDSSFDSCTPASGGGLASPAMGRGSTSSCAAFISPRAPRSPMAANLGYRQRSSCWAASPGQSSPIPRPHLASQSSLSWGDTTSSSPRAANSPSGRCARAALGSGSARRLHLPLWPAPAPACLTPTAAQVFHAAAAAAADGDSAL